MNDRIARLYVTVALGLGTTLCACGCGQGDGLPRQEISGQVTLDGQPLADGSIEFQPDAATPGPAVSAGALIEAGSYRIGRDQGLVPGMYKVMILSHGSKEPSAAPADPGAQTPPPPELIPPKYNVATTLNAEVVKDRPNVFKFDLKK